MSTFEERVIESELCDFTTHPGRAMTEEEFVAWCDEKVRAEWVDGEVVLSAPVNIEHARTFLFLLEVFAQFIRHGRFGELLAEPMQVRLGDPARRRSPDLFFVAAHCKEIIREICVDGAPDLIVEIVSPESVARDWREKYVEYEATGVREYWIVDPIHQRLEAYSLDLDEKRYAPIPERDGSVGSKVLAGFAIDPGWFRRGALPDPDTVLRAMGIT